MDFRFQMVLQFLPLLPMMDSDLNLTHPLFVFLSSNFLSRVKWHGLFNRPQSSRLLMCLTVLFYFSGITPTLHLLCIPQGKGFPPHILSLSPPCPLWFSVCLYSYKTEAASRAGQPGSRLGCLGFICSSYIDFILVSKAMNDLKAGFC